jgi:peptide/nickel transport system substrate-binding protein
MASMLAACFVVAGAKTLVAQETPNQGGDLTMAVHGASSGDSLDPRSFNSPFMAVVSGTVFNTLVEATGSEAELEPGLAKSWETLNKGKTWQFHLVDGAMFHNGAPVTPADVIFSFELHSEDSGRSNSRAIVANIESMRDEGENSVVFELDEPNYFFPAMLTNYSLVIVPAGTTEFDGIGSGAYRITHFSPGEILEAERFEDYFKSDKGHVNTVSILAVNDVSARVSSIQSGQVDLATQLDPRSVPLLESLPTVEINFLQGNGFAGFNMMLNQAPFDELKLRQALKHAIDREDIIQRIYNGYARLGNDTPVPPNFPEFAEDVPQMKYDPERARQLYEESGHSGPIVLQTSDAVGGTAVDMAALFREHAARAGIDIEVRREPADGYWGNVWAQTPFHATLWGGRATSEMMLSLAYSSDSASNDTAFVSEAFDEALADARSGETFELRNEALAEAQRILSEQGGAIIPAFENIPEGISSRLRGYIPGTILAGSTRAAEDVWFD